MIVAFIIKSSICLSLFLVFYHYFLEKEQLHIFKRYYLLSILFVSFAIPLITFKTYIEVPLENFITNDFIVDKSLFLNPEQSIYNLWTPILFIYSLGFLIMGYKFLKNLVYLFQKISSNPKQLSNGLTIVLLEEDIAPYSFSKYMLVNREKYIKNDIPEEVFVHEKTHIAQRHTIDVILIELIQIIFWFNPIINMIKKAIKLNHEFLADASVLDHGMAIKSYQHSLLSFFTYPQQQELISSINYAIIEKRFLIMNKKINKKTAYLKIAIIIPLFIFSLSSFSNKVDVPIPKEITNVSEIEASPSIEVSAIPEIYYLMEERAEFIYEHKTISNSEVKALIKQGIKLNFTVFNSPSNKLKVKLFSS